MELAPANDLFDSVAAIRRPLSVGATTAARRRIYVIAAIAGLALVLRLYGITNYPLFGDEYNSIAGARDINLNWNSILYAVLTHFLIRLGDTEFWLRLPSVIFGVATVPILFRIGERLGGWRCAVACGLLAAVSPFSIFHSQEMRFYSLFILASAIFVLGTIHFLDRPRSIRRRVLFFLSAVFLVLSHFLGILALCAQLTAAVFAHRKTSKGLRAAVLAGFGILVGLPLVPFFQHRLWDFYSSHAGVADLSLPVINEISLVNFAKLAYAIFTFAFGYHVYPMRLGLVILGSAVFAILLLVGVIQLWKKSEWRLLPVTYLLALVAVLFVLNSIGGRVSMVIGPRHVAFVWPVFVLLIGIGLSALPRKLFAVLLTAVMSVSLGSLWLGWQKDWSSGNVPDYRAAATYATQWNDSQTALFVAGRSDGPFEFYFPKSIRIADWISYLQTDDLRPLRSNRRLIFVSDEWSQERRLRIDRSLREVTEGYTLLDGRVDYPLFEYIFDRRPPAENSATDGSTRHLQFPPSIYGLEFQDVKLPVTVTAQGVRLRVLGATQLPNLDDEKLISASLSTAARAQKLILLSNLTGPSLVASGTIVAELLVEDKAGVVTTMPIRVGMETAFWDQSCESSANCQSAFQWHKRMAVVGRSSYPGAWRDFVGQIQAATFDLPDLTEVARVSIRYRAEAGHLYVWGAALT